MEKMFTLEASQSNFVSNLIEFLTKTSANHEIIWRNLFRTSPRGFPCQDRKLHCRCKFGFMYKKIINLTIIFNNFLRIHLDPTSGYYGSVYFSDINTNYIYSIKCFNENIMVGSLSLCNVLSKESTYRIIPNI